MGITIEEAIKQLTTYSIPCGKYKNAYDMAIETMRKYQKIEQLMKGWNNFNSYERMCDIYEVLEDGNDSI